MYASFLVLLALLSLLLPSCSFCPRVSLHVGPLGQQRLCIQMAIDAEKTVDDLIKLADRMHLYSDSKVRFVAMILAMQNEVAQAQVQKDHELAQAQAGKDRKFELQLAEKDHQLKVAERDHKFELEHWLSLTDTARFQQSPRGLFVRVVCLPFRNRANSLLSPLFSDMCLRRSFGSCWI